MAAKARGRAFASAVLALALSVTGLSAAGLSAAAAVEPSLTLTLDHPSPFMAGEQIGYTVSVEGIADGQTVEIEGLDHYIDTWVPLDYVTVEAGSAHGTLSAKYLHEYEEYPVHARVGEVVSPDIDVHISLLETTVTGDASISAGETATLQLHAPVAWANGHANLYVRTATGTWKKVASNISIDSGIAEVLVTPTAATRYRFTVLDEPGIDEVYTSPDFVVDVVYAAITVTPNTPDSIDATFIRGQSVTSTFAWGRRGTSDTVTLQWGRMNSGIVWAAQSTKKSLNGYVSFTWKPSAGHIYRYKVVRSGHTYYSPTFVIAREITLTATAPHYVSPGVPFKVSVSTKGWGRTYGDIWATKIVGNQHYAERFAAKYGKGTATLAMPLGATAEVSYEEQPLPGEWWLVPMQSQSLDVVVRELKLYQSKSFSPGDDVPLVATVGDSSYGTGSVYARPVGVATWYRVGSANFVSGVADFSYRPSGTREVKVVLDGQSTNVVTLRQQ